MLVLFWNSELFPVFWNTVVMPLLLLTELLAIVLLPVTEFGPTLFPVTFPSFRDRLTPPSPRNCPSCADGIAAPASAPSTAVSAPGGPAARAPDPTVAPARTAS